MPPKKEEKTLDIVVFGATGYVGKLIVEYLKTHKDAPSFAICGRSQQKLKELHTELGLSNAIEIIVADVSDAAALTKVVKRTRCVLTTVGPYTLYGEPMLKACAENGTHYVDLTGEHTWVKQMIIKYNETAMRTGAIIVPCCGFDSIPSDIGVFLVSEKLSPAPLGSVFSVFSMKGGMSGGTFQSGLAIADSDAKVHKDAAGVYCLSPVKGKQPSWMLLPWLQLSRRRLLAPFIMESVNMRVVYRSWGLLQSQRRPYGPDFRYREYFTFGRKPSLMGNISAMIFIPMIYMILFFFSFSFVRSLLKKYGLQAGDGPSKEVRDSGWSHVEVFGSTADQSKKDVELIIDLKGDPGYKATSVLIGESAICLSRHSDKLPPSSNGAGILTPATAMGSLLVDRLVKSGVFSYSFRGEAETRKGK